MAENMIPITYFVSASAVTPQQGLEPLKISTILLLTDETPAIEQTNSYFISRTASSVANTWGTTTETALQANAIFSQQPNILVNNGYLIVAQMQQSVTPEPIPATAGTLTTVDLTDNLAAIIATSNGALTITVDGGDAQAITGLDFTGTTTLEGVAEILGNAITGATVTATGTTLVFTSSTTGSSSSVAIAATEGESITDLYGENYLNGAEAITVQGSAEIQPPSAPETLTQAITRLSKEIYFEGVITTRTVSDSEYIEASNFIQAMNNRVLMLPRSTTGAISGIFQQVKSNYNTKNIYYGLGDSEAQAAQNARIFAAAYLSRAMAVNYSGSNTTLTMNLKTLTGIQADTTVTETILTQLEEAGADCYVSVEGLAKVVSNSQGGYFFDQVTNSIWFVNAIQREVFNTIATVGTKIAQTEDGLQIIADAIQRVCAQAVANGYLAPGTWNSADTFGNYEDFLRNIREYGFYQYHQPIAQQSQSEREQRQAPFWQIAGKEAGAVHSANILIYLEA